MYHSMYVDSKDQIQVVCRYLYLPNHLAGLYRHLVKGYMDAKLKTLPTYMYAGYLCKGETCHRSWSFSEGSHSILPYSLYATSATMSQSKRKQ